MAGADTGNPRQGRLGCMAGSLEGPPTEKLKSRLKLISDC